MKFKKIIVLFLILIVHVKVKALSYNGSTTSGGTGSGDSNGCRGLTSWCTYNNDSHMTISVSLYHFNGGGNAPTKHGNTIYYTNSGLRGNWVHNKFKDNKIKEFSYELVSNSVKSKLKYSDRSQGYNGLNDYFTNEKAFNEAIERITSNKNLNDYVKGYTSTYKNNFHEDIGGRYGWRLVIEPYYSYTKYWGASNEEWEFRTSKQNAIDIKNKLDLGIGISSTNITTWDDDKAGKYLALLYTNRSDVGVTIPDKHELSKVASNGCNNSVNCYDLFSNGANYLYGYGMNMVVPPYKIKNKCDVSEKGIKACCIEVGITPMDTKKNTKEYLTEVLSFDQINIKCGNANRCDPDLGGEGENVKKCCDEYDIKRNNTYANTYEYLMRPLTTDEINYICDPKCDYKISSNAANNCEISKNTSIVDIDNWDCIFYSKKSNYNEVKINYADYKNNYCAFYCREEVYIDYPDESARTEAGSYMTIEKDKSNGLSNVIAPIKATSIKTCRTTDVQSTLYKYPNTSGRINKLKFLNDYSSANPTDKRSILNEYNACFDKYKISSNFQPVIKFYYEEPFYKKSWYLNIANSTETRSIKYYSGGDSIKGEGISYPNPGQATLIDGNMYYSPTWVEITIKNENYYTLPTDVYKYVSKQNAMSFDSKAAAGGISYNMGMSNLPVHFTTLPGKYDFYVDVEKLNSSSHKFDKYLKGNNTFGGKNVIGADGKYACTFTVTCDDPSIINDCEKWTEKCGKPSDKCEEGVTIKFRTIALGEKKVSFPGQNGLGRTPGTNWNNEMIIEEKILENRGVETYDIYQLDPIYEIVLTPTTMKLIREYNKKMNTLPTTIYYNNSTSSTGVLGYTSYDGFTCKDDGTECVSQNLRDWGVRGCGILLENGKYDNCGNSNGW